jgi:hypothetical protein
MGVEAQLAGTPLALDQDAAAGFTTPCDRTNHALGRSCVMDQPPRRTHSGPDRVRQPAAEPKPTT